MGVASFPGEAIRAAPGEPAHPRRRAESPQETTQELVVNFCAMATSTADTAKGSTTLAFFFELDLLVLEKASRGQIEGAFGPEKVDASGKLGGAGLG